MTQLVETQRRLIVGVLLLAIALIALDRGGLWFTGFIATIQIVGSVELVRLLLPTPLRVWLLPIFGLWLVTTSSFLYLYRPSLELIGWTLFLGPGYDTSAFVVGRLWGCHRLPPSLSANKTWEGCLGGVLGGSCLSLIYYWRLTTLMEGTFTVSHPFTIVLITNTIAMLADLLASWLKRRCHQKDAGFHRVILATGHGGVVDRFFSPSAAATALLIYLMIFEQFARQQ